MSSHSKCKYHITRSTFPIFISQYAHNKKQPNKVLKYKRYYACTVSLWGFELCTI